MDEDFDNEAAQAEIDEFKNDARLVWQMSQTNGWEILSNRLREIEKAHLADLLDTPVVPDNLGVIALAQSKVAAVRMIFAEVQNYIAAVDKEDE
ncbi:hypothetical protein [Caudoviricetes sp.]|nr:hypothetical protein [Caudoviricetes sp.]